MELRDSKTCLCFFYFLGSAAPPTVFSFLLCPGDSDLGGARRYQRARKKPGVFLALCQRFGRGLTAARVRKNQGCFGRPPGAAGPQRERKFGVANLAPFRKVKKRSFHFPKCLFYFILGTVFLTLALFTSQ